MRLNIIHILPYAGIGGIEKNCELFIKNYSDAAHKLKVLDSYGSSIDLWKKAGAEIEILDILKLNPIFFYYKLKNTAKNWRADYIIYWSNIRLPLVLAAIKKHSVKYRIHLGNPYNLNLLTRIKDKVLERLPIYPEQVILMGVSSQVLNTYNNKPFYRKFLQKVGYKPIYFPTYREYTAKEFNKNSVINFGCIARLDPIKDFITLISAFKLIKNDFPGAYLHIIGDGPFKKVLVKHCSNNNLENSVHFYGEKLNVIEYYALFDIFLYCTTHNEGLAGTVGEAIANSIPVVCSDIPSLKEYIITEDAISWVPPYDPVKFYLSVKEVVLNSRQRQNMVQTAYKELRAKFKPELFIKRFMSEDFI